MLSPERCPGPEEVEPEEVHDRRKCTTGGSVRVKGVCRWRKGGVPEEGPELDIAMS